MNLREKLTPLGWVQGSLISGSSLGEDFSHDFYLIITQTCDLLHHSIAIEPSIELLGLTKIAQNRVNKELKNARSPRKIHFKISLSGSSQWVATSMQEISHLDRSILVEQTPAAQAFLHPASLRDLIRWRANRYLRPAFPNDFDRLLKCNKNHDKLKKWITKEQGLIQEIRVLVDPFTELSTNEFYVIDFLFLIDPKLFIDTNVREKLKTLCFKIENCYKETPRLNELTCRFLPLDKVTLYQVKDFLRWSPHDHLSFGDDEPL